MVEQNIWEHFLEEAYQTCDVILIFTIYVISDRIIIRSKSAQPVHGL